MSLNPCEYDLEKLDYITLSFALLVFFWVLLFVFIFQISRLQLHEEWLERERLAQEEFRLKSEREETARKKKEEDEVNCLRQRRKEDSL